MRLTIAIKFVLLPTRSIISDPDHENRSSRRAPIESSDKRRGPGGIFKFFFHQFRVLLSNSKFNFTLSWVGKTLDLLLKFENT